MPTTSQWKILHSLLRAGRLKQPDSTTDGGDEKTENDNENKNEHQTALSKQMPERRNSFHFSKNGHGILTIICRPKSVPVRFSSKRETDCNSNEITQHHSNEQRVDQNQTTFSGVNLDDIIFEDNNRLQDVVSVEESNTKLNSDSIISPFGDSRYDTSSTTYTNQPFQAVPDEDDFETPQCWDGISSFPELLDPNGMGGSNVPIRQGPPSASALKRWRLANSINGVITKPNKNVTFSRAAFGDTDTTRHVQEEKGGGNDGNDVLEKIDDEDDEDSMEINFDNVDKILPKFNNPLSVYSNIKNNNRKHSLPGCAPPGLSHSKSPTNARSLRPLKSAPAMRGISKSLSVFNSNKNNNKNNNTHQRSKSSLGSSYTTSTTSEIDPGISNDFNNSLINATTTTTTTTSSSTSNSSNTGCSGVFKIRHTTFAYKEFPSVLGRPKSASSSLSVSSARSKLTAGGEFTKPRVTVPGESSSSEGFEPYVIHNGRLVRRGSMSNGMFAPNSLGNAPGSVRRGSAKFSILGKDEATTLSRICDAFVVRGGSGTSSRPTTNGPLQLQRPLSGPWPTKAVSRWSMATQSIITRSVSTGSLAAIGSATPRASGLEQSRVTVTDAEEIELPEEVQADLQKLGFRKQKGKRKKDKSEKAKKALAKKQEAQQQSVKSMGIDLKQDPMLLKVQKKNRNVGTFPCEPVSQPCAVCFEIIGSAPSHADVMAEITKLTKTHPEVAITKLQFDYRALVNNSPDMENRWIVTTNSVTSRNRMAGSHIRVLGQEAQLRRYDDVITTEYQQYKRMMDFVKMMNSRLGMK